MSVKLKLKPLAAAALTLAAVATGAGTAVVECEAPDGSITFARSCPPGTTLSGRRVVTTAPSAPERAADASETHPVTLYTVTDCEACDLMRITLERTGVPFEEVNVAADVEAQAMLSERFGKIRAPVTTVGARAIPGYDRQGLRTALAEAGYAVN